MKRIHAILPNDYDLSAIVAAATSITITSTTSTKAAAEAPRKRRVINRRYVAGTSVMETVGGKGHFTPHGEFGLDDARKWVKTAGYAATSASGALTALVKAGYLAKVGPSRYRFIRMYEAA